MPPSYHHAKKWGQPVRIGAQGSIYLYIPPCRTFPGSDFLSVFWFLDNVHQLLDSMRCGVDQEVQISLLGDMYRVFLLLNTAGWHFKTPS